MIDQAELARAPKITLGEKTWFIPKLAMRQSREIRKLARALTGSGSDASQTGQASEEQIEAMFEVCYIALTRANPELTKEAFEDLPIFQREVVAALPVIMRQAGFETEEVGNAPAAAT